MDLKLRQLRPRRLFLLRTLTLFFALLLAVGGSWSVEAKESAANQIRGKIVGENEISLVGVSIKEKGTLNGTISDENGEFIITPTTDEPVLECWYFGYTPVEMKLGNQSYIEIAMSENVFMVDDVVVIGYGTTTQKEVTGSVSSIKSDDFKSGSISNPLQLLQGEVAGLNIVRPDGGDPNGEFEIQLRGVTTMAGGTAPLVVIDGVVGGDISNISVEAIESIDVLKDGSAAAIYGTRGTNGVILITTKQPKEGSNTIEFSTYMALQTVDKKPGVMSASQFRNTLETYFPDKVDAYDFGASTDWFDEITRKAPLTQNYNVATYGGSKSLSYRANVSYQDEQGLVKNSETQRLRARLNISQRLINDRLKVDYMLGYSSRKGSYADWYIMRQAMLRNPTEPVYKNLKEGEHDPYSQYGEYFFAPGFEYHNPVAMLEEMDDKGKRNEFTGSINATFNITDDLKVGAMGAIVRTDDRYGHYYGRYYPISMGNNGFAETYNHYMESKTLETTVDYSKQFGDHKLQAIAGYSFNEVKNESYSNYNFGFDTDFFSYHNIGAGKKLQEGQAGMSSGKSSSRLVSFFARAMYNYKERYLFSASVRYEGSSRFGQNHKWGTFPAISIGWRLSEESFLKNVRWIDELKIRAGYGVTGNQEIGNYRSLSTLRKGSSNFYYDQNWVSTYEPASNPNPDLKWEKKGEFNFGLDFSLLNNRLGGAVDYYSRRTKDMIWTYEVPSPPNLYPYKIANLGTLKNKGIEVTLFGNPIKTKNFSWNLTATASHNSNKLANFSNKEFEMTYLDQGYFGDDLKVYTMRVIEGRSIGNFWGPKFTGFDADGGAMYEDLDGVEGITEADYQVIGNAYPDVLLSLQSTLTYKNFDLSFLLRASIGNDVLNQSRVYYEGFGYFGGRNVLSSTLDHPDYRGGAVYSSRFVEDGSYLKLDNLTIGYNVPLKSKVVSNLRVYFTGQNLFTITGYKGVDPEVTLQGLAPGIDWYDFYPRTKTFVFGASIRF